MRRRTYTRREACRLGAAGLTAAALPRTARAAAPLVASGKGTFTFNDAGGFPGKPMPVHTYLPEGVAPETAPVLYVMHGTLRNGAEYRDLWVDQAKKYGALLLVPEFSREDYPSGLYNRGNVRGRDDAAPEPESRWTFGVLERLFDYFKKETGSREAGYRLYGHSAGGQFVHRLMLLQPQTRCLRAVAANAGYYTLPTLDADPPYPFSLKGIPSVDATRQKTVFGRDLVILLGEADTDPKDPDLYHSPEADAQGLYRLARGKYFYTAAQKEAQRVGVPLRWRLRTVPGVGHSNEKMAPAAAAILWDKEKTP